MSNYKVLPCPHCNFHHAFDWIAGYTLPSGADVSQYSSDDSKALRSCRAEIVFGTMSYDEFSAVFDAVATNAESTQNNSGYTAWKTRAYDPDGKLSTYKIAQNRHGNRYGYRGSKRVEMFFNTSTGTMEQNALTWLRNRHVWHSGGNYPDTLHPITRK